VTAGHSQCQMLVIRE